MKILILTPIWKRPEILELFINGYKRLKMVYKELDLLCILSPEDPNAEYNADLLIQGGANLVYYHNDYLGEKKNAGLNHALDNYEFDYLMDLGSDNILNPDIFEAYMPYFKKGELFIGLKNLYVHNWHTKRTVFVDNYNNDHTYGAGRLYHKELLSYNFWPHKINSGLDFAINKRLVTVREIGINSKHPYCLDIKSNTNINDFDFIKLRCNTKDVEFKDIAQYFGLNIYEDWILKLQTFEGFRDYFYQMASTGITYQQAYRGAESVYKQYFGLRRYRNYETFRQAIISNDKKNKNRKAISN